MKLEKECSYYKKKYADNNTIQLELEKWDREGTYKVFMELCLNLYLHMYSFCQVPKIICEAADCKEKQNQCRVIKVELDL